jgi:uncharacterized protein (TIGR03435 family)
MSVSKGARIGLAALFLTAALAAQQPAAPKFDVVSIHSVPPNAPPVMREPDFTPVLPGGQYIHSRAGLFEMIAFAYNVQNASNQLLGLPNWANEQSFSVAAKPTEGFSALPSAENREQVRLMMRAMLADRFHLQVHKETRQKPIFKLEVAKGGIKIREVDPPVPPATEGNVYAVMGDGRVRINGKKSTMAGVAKMLSVALKRPVVDETGLTSYYDLDMKWNDPDAPGGQPRVTGFGAENAGLLNSILQDELGLRLTNANGPVEYWVVDHVEPPTAN